MIAGSSSEHSQPCQSQPFRSSVNLPLRRQTENPAKKTYQKLSAKLRDQDLPGVEFAEKYLFHQYRRNRRPNTMELNYTSISFFLKFLKSQGLTHLEGVSRKHIEAFIEKTGPRIEARLH